MQTHLSDELIKIIRRESGRKIKQHTAAESRLITTLLLLFKFPTRYFLFSK
ncbi:hypothetical protein NIASO_15600 [Niabella soli DSM 19437]|uniref:Uncharacterized protein n=1 Tax=Niabella soli DSM 19437 TaxID=929713 RepID=W0F8S0_9BACT|nr:hypothetical protein NIASO_15600 [Niabella soli DSM 19437]